MVLVFHSGKILDQSGSPLIGAHVVLSTNSAIGTTTDFDGNFQIQGEAGQQYKIGHLGKKTTAVTLKKGMPAANYMLVDNAFVLDEFVGKPKKKKKYVVVLAVLATAIYAANKIFN